jgi:hypothetical protein
MGILIILIYVPLDVRLPLDVRPRSPKELKMGKSVYLKTREGLYVFEKLNLWNRLKHRLKGSPK